MWPRLPTDRRADAPPWSDSRVRAILLDPRRAQPQISVSENTPNSTQRIGSPVRKGRADRAQRPPAGRGARRGDRDLLAGLFARTMLQAREQVCAALKETSDADRRGVGRSNRRYPSVHRRSASRKRYPGRASSADLVGRPSGGCVRRQSSGLPHSARACPVADGGLDTPSMPVAALRSTQWFIVEPSRSFLDDLTQLHHYRSCLSKFIRTGAHLLG